MHTIHSMITIIDNLLAKSLNIFKNRWIRFGIQLIVLFICGLFVYRYSADLIKVARQIRINGGRLFFSWLILSIIYLFIGTTSWWLILKGLGETPEWLKSANIQLNSTLAKYIPGYIWQYLGKAALTKEVGISSRVSGIAMAYELGQTLLIGLGIAGILYSAYDRLTLPGFEKIHLVAFPLGILAILISFMFVLLSPFILSRGLIKNSIQPRYLFASLLLITIGWLLLSISFWLMATSITLVITVVDFRLFILATTVSLVAGILFIPVPNGIGVRESFLVMILGSTMGIPLAIVFAAITRLLLTVSEITSVVLMGVFSRKSINFKRKLPLDR